MTKEFYKMLMIDTLRIAMRFYLNAEPNTEFANSMLNWLVRIKENMIRGGFTLEQVQGLALNSINR